MMSCQGTPDILVRKEEHLQLALANKKRPRGTLSHFTSFAVAHCAIPEMRLEDKELTTAFLGKALKTCFLNGSVTGGPTQAERITHYLCQAAQEPDCSP